MSVGDWRASFTSVRARYAISGRLQAHFYTTRVLWRVLLNLFSVIIINMPLFFGISFPWSGHLANNHHVNLPPFHHPSGSLPRPTFCHLGFFSLIPFVPDIGRCSRSPASWVEALSLNPCSTGAQPCSCPVALPPLCGSSGCLGIENRYAMVATCSALGAGKKWAPTCVCVCVSIHA